MSRKPKNYLPNQIRRYRRHRGLRLVDVAALIEQRSAAHLSAWEKGKRMPNLTNALKLSAALQCPVEILFSDLFNKVREDLFVKRNALGIKFTYPTHE